MAGATQEQRLLGVGSTARLGPDLNPRPALARRVPCSCLYGETVPEIFSYC